LDVSIHYYYFYDKLAWSKADTSSLSSILVKKVGSQMIENRVLIEFEFYCVGTLFIDFEWPLISRF